WWTAVPEPHLALAYVLADETMNVDGFFVERGAALLLRRRQAGWTSDARDGQAKGKDHPAKSCGFDDSHRKDSRKTGGSADERHKNGLVVDAVPSPQPCRQPGFEPGLSAQPKTGHGGHDEPVGEREQAESRQFQRHDCAPAESGARLTALQWKCNQGER